MLLSFDFLFYKLIPPIMFKENMLICNQLYKYNKKTK